MTKEGEEALKDGEERFFRSTNERYKKWRKLNAPEKTKDPDKVEEEEENEKRSLEITIEETQQLAKETIEEYIRSKNPYEFQDLVAALLRGMGYHTPFVAPRGKDGGIDVIAYGDPLGTTTPRIKIQVKHRESSSSAADIRQLSGVLKEGDVSIFVATGGFTSNARQEARNATPHMELIDLERFISLWQEFYKKLGDEDKSLLPLLPVYFVEPGDDK